MSPAGQDLADGSSFPDRRVRRYLLISTVVRFLAIAGVVAAARGPGFRPLDARLYWGVALVGVLANLAYLAGSRRSVSSLSWSGLSDAALIGLLGTLAGGGDSPLVLLMALVIAWHGAYYGWKGIFTGVAPGVAGMTLAAYMSPEFLDASRLVITTAALSGLGLLSAWMAEEEKKSRASLGRLADLRTKEAHQIEVLYETSAVIQSQVEAEALLTTAVERTQELATGLWGRDPVTAITMIDRDRQEMEVIRVTGSDARAGPATRFSLSAVGAKVLERLEEGHTFVLRQEDFAELRSMFGLPPEAVAFVAPIVVEGEVAGTLSVRLTALVEPDPSQLELLQTVANHVASGVARLRTLHREGARREQATKLFELARDLNSLTDTRRLLDAVSAATLDLTGADACGLGLLSEEGALEPMIWSGPAVEPNEVLEPLPREEFEAALSGRRPIEMRDFASSPATRRVAHSLGLQSLLAMPVLSHSGPIGVLVIGLSVNRSFSIMQWQILEAIAGLTGVAVENVRLFEAERRTVEELRELDRRKTEYVATASHELRSPLTSIAGFASTLLKQGVKFTEEERHEFLSVIDQQAKQLARLIDELLTVSRIEEGRVALSLKRVDLPTLVLDLVSASKMQTDAHLFDLDFPADLPPIVADENKLTEIVTNLLDNAIKYSPEGGRVTIGAKFADHEFRFWVSDEGAGIPPEELSKIFDRFYQVQDRPKAAGTGLGLYIVSQLVEAHNGRIWVDSEPERGTTFNIAFPQRRATDRLPIH